MVCLKEIKQHYKVQGLDFEGNLVKLYQQARMMMAFEHSKYFGPIKPIEVLTEGSLDEKLKSTIRNEHDKNRIKLGYERVKTKIREFRGDYRNRFSTKKRFHNGKIDASYWDCLENLWGKTVTSSFTTTNNSRMTLNINTPNEEYENKNEEEYENKNEDEYENKNEEEYEHNLSHSLECIGRINVPNLNRNTIPTFDFNSNSPTRHSPSNHQGHVLNSTGHDDLWLNKLVQNLLQATTETNKTLEKISVSIDQVGKALSDGFTILAKAIGQNNWKPMQNNTMSYSPPTTSDQQHPRSPRMMKERLHRSSNNHQEMYFFNQSLSPRDYLFVDDTLKEYQKKVYSSRKP